MAELQLRPYQVEAINGLRQRLAAGDKRVILCAPTGSGKTEMAMHLIQEADRKNSRVAFVADRVTLVEQTSKRLWANGIRHGVAQGDNTIGRYEPIQVCSAQTIEKRDYWKEIDLLIIDECHTQRAKIQEFAVNWGGPVVGLSATPLTEGLGKTYQSIVNATTTDELLADQWLSPLKVFAAKEIGMQGALKTAGEWQAKEVRERGRKVIGDIVSEWVRHTQEHFGGPVPTLLFSADVAHGEELCRAFQMAGYDFRQSSYRDSQDATTEMVEAFRAGKFTGLVSVEKFVKGFDVPDVRCMVGARPYSSSLASVIQQLGRGMRISNGKDYCLYLDHAGNMEGWYEECQRHLGQRRCGPACGEEREAAAQGGETTRGHGLPRMPFHHAAERHRVPLLRGGPEATPVAGQDGSGARGRGRTPRHRQTGMGAHRRPLGPALPRCR